MLSKKELEDIRPWVSESVTTFLGFSEDTVVSAALDCVAKSLSRQATTDQLTPFLDNAAPQFVELLYRKVLEIKSSKLASNNFAVSSAPSKRRRVQDVFGEQEEDMPKQPAPKKKRVSRFEAARVDDDSPPPPPTSLTADVGGMEQSEIQELLATTMKQIEERKKHTQSLMVQHPSPAALLPTPTIPPFHITQTPEYQHNVMSDAIEKARKAAELQARIQSQLQSRPGLLSSLGKPGDKFQAPSKPTPLILDEAGRTVDATGRTIQLSVRQPTLKANIRAQQRASFKQITEKPQKKKEEREEEKTVYFDDRVGLPSTQRGKKQFRFNDPGKFIMQGQMLRAKAQLDLLQTDIASAARKTGISSATKLALLAPSREGREEEVPLVEWWDANILPNRSYADFDQQVEVGQKYKDITKLIEHPPSQPPPGEPSAPPTIPIMLTKKERKKLRQQRRREAEREKQEKIQFGLADKPEPKVRISNLMRVLGNEAIQDPTKIEAHVRAQMAERQRRHEQANAARKLTPEQRKAKKRKKLKEDLSCGTYVTVYRVRDLSRPAIKFKVDMNAQQYHLTGCVLLYRDVNLVIVEGGPKCLKKFKKLMLHRIKWTPDRHGDDEGDSDSEAQREKQNSCSIVWEGKVQDRCFQDWKIKGFPTDGLAREHLKRYGVEHYWDLALSETIVEQEGN